MCRRYSVISLQAFRERGIHACVMCHAGFAKFNNFLRLYMHIENEDHREVPRYLLGNLFVAVTFLASGCMKQFS